MAIRQTRIYVPRTLPYDDVHWAETVMARIIKPLVISEGLNWFWFTRYVSEVPEFADSDGTNVPIGFFDKQYCRSLRFRFEIEDQHSEAFEAKASALIRQEKCWQADWRTYDDRELCSNRFLGEDRGHARRNERLAIVKDYTQIISRLTLHALVPADKEGRFRFEDNDDPQNPHKSAFFSLHHLFCNPTGVLLTVLVADVGAKLVCGTRQYLPDELLADPTIPCIEFPVRF